VLPLLYGHPTSWGVLESTKGEQRIKNLPKALNKNHLCDRVSLRSFPASVFFSFG